MSKDNFIDTETGKLEDPVEQNGEGVHEKEEEDLQQKYDDLNDRYIRLYADFENIRRRHATEKAQIAQHVKIDLITSFLPCIDDLERGISSMQSHELDASQVLEGLGMVHSKITDVLVNSWNINLLGAVDEPFDPRVHEALSTVEGEQYTEEKVVEVYQKGYTLQDRVIRPAKVLVSKPAIASDAKQGKTTPADEESDKKVDI